MIALPEVHELSLPEKIGQVLCLGWSAVEEDDASTVNAHARSIVQDLHAGSLVVLKRNLPVAHSSRSSKIQGAMEPEAARELLNAMQALADVPLLVSADQEGGGINRFGPPLHAFPGNMALGAAQEGERLAERQAEAVAQELRALGVHWNCAPVVDVNNNPDNPVIGLRSFGEDPALVARLGAAAVSGYQNAGLLACAKHFPGHGDTSVDSHVALPTVSHLRARLDAVELLPFRAAIAAGVGSIMTTHILFSTLDPERPATLSHAILTDLLRKELGYEGLVITDCLEMNAIAGTVGVGRGAVEALKAGADVVLICHTWERQQEAYYEIIKAVASGELPEARLEEAVGRALAAKRRFLSAPSPEDAVPWQNPAHTTLERDIARAALTVVRNKGTMPLIRRKHRPLLLTAFPKAMLQPYLPFTLVTQLHPEFVEKETTALLRSVRGREGDVIFATAQYGRIDQKAQERMVRELLRLHPNLIVVALESPYDLRRFPEVQNYLCTYGIRPCNLQALGDFLNGQFEATGRLPVTII